MIIYLARNKTNGKVYIGQTIRSLTTRKTEHVSHAENFRNNGVFSKALRKHGKDNFTWEVLWTASSMEELNAKEKYFISKYDCRAHKRTGYNIESGGNNSPASTETKEKMSKLKRTKKYIEISKMNLPKDTSGKNNGRYKSIDTKSLAIDFENSILLNRQLENKYDISRPTIVRKLKVYFGDRFKEVQLARGKLLEVMKCQNQSS